jgi:hypothetical protein
MYEEVISSQFALRDKRIRDGSSEKKLPPLTEGSKNGYSAESCRHGETTTCNEVGELGGDA